MASRQYTQAQLRDDGMRAEIEAELMGVRWAMTVRMADRNFGFLSHRSFPQGVFYVPSAFPPGRSPCRGDEAEVEVAVAWDKKRGRWGFRAQQGAVKPRSAGGQPSNLPSNTWTSVPWPKLIARLVRSGQTQSRDGELAEILQWCATEGLDVGPLQGWIPDEAEARVLGEAERLVQSASNPNTRLRAERRREAEARLRSLPTRGSALTSLAAAFLDAIPAEPSRSASSSRGQGRNAPDSGSSTRPGPSHKAIKKKKKYAKQMRVLKGRPPIRMKRTTDWGRDAREITIYVDEVWPDKPGKAGEGPIYDDPKKFGVLAGIAWIGSDVEASRLTVIEDHPRDIPEMLDALEELEACDDAFPFIMPIRLPDDAEAPGSHYDALVVSCLKLLLGWILPSHRAADGTDVRVYLDRIGDKHHGTDLTSYFAGLIDADTRYQRWHIKKVQWFDTERVDSYIPYGDLLAYLAYQGSDKSRRLGRHTEYRTWHGYTPLGMDTVPQLEQLEKIEQFPNVRCVLDFAASSEGDELHKIVLKRLEPVFARSSTMQQELLEELDTRYKDKNRDLWALRYQTEAALQLVPVLDESSHLRIRLLDAAIRFQAANHDGDPEKYATLAQEYAPLREEGLANDPDLAIHCELNRAVRHADTFDFGQALLVAEDLVGLGRFEHERPIRRGRVFSSQGQYLSMLGDHDAAAASFAVALAEFEEANVPEESRDSEWDQTAVYRALDALDDRPDDARWAVEEVLGDLRQAVDDLAQASPTTAEYHHHLLLRSLEFLGDEAASPLQDAYLDHHDAWKQGDQHPWELIALYRAILCWRAGRHEAAQQWFDQAIDVAFADRHGLTLQLIGGMIATAAHWCYPEGLDGEAHTYEQRARRALQEVSSKLPNAASACEALLDILDDPAATDDIRDILSLLPLIYH